MRVYGLKNCDKVRAAMKDLAAKGHAPELVDVRAAPLAPQDIARFEAAFGAILLNTRSTTWRGLDAQERARPMAELLADHPALMKRPVVEEGARITLGWDAAAKSVWL